MKVSLKGVSVEIPLTVGETVEEAVELVGTELVHELYKAGAEKLGAAVVKRYMRKEWTEERIAGAMAEWTPASVVKKIVDPVAKMHKAFEKLSEEERELFKAAL